MDEDDSQDELINRSSKGKGKRAAAWAISDDSDEAGSDEEVESESGEEDEEEHLDEEDDDEDEDEDEDEEEEDGEAKPGEEGACAGTSADVEASSDDEAEKCPICLHSFSRQPVATPENCEHYFCLDCILEWSKNANSCPIDRTNFKVIYLRTCFGGKVQKMITIQKPAKQCEQETVDLNLEETSCEVCGGSDREDRLLLCDGCDAGYHMECLTPPLDAVPVEEWFCPECEANNRQSRSSAAETSDTDSLPSTARTASSRSRSHTGQTRAIARTQHSERVRANVNRHRITQARTQELAPTYLIRSTWLDETINAVVAGLNSAVYVRDLTHRPSTTRRRKARKTKGRKTSAKSKKGKATSTGVKRRKRRVRRTKSRKKMVMKKTPTPRSRIANSLGIVKDKKSSSLPTVYRPSESTLSSMRADIGAASLSIYGDPFDLDPFTDREDDEHQIHDSVLLEAKRRGISRSAFRSHQPVARPVSLSRRHVSVPQASVVAEAAPVPDLLGSILSGQSMLLMDSSDVIINRDGSLKATKSTSFTNTLRPSSSSRSRSSSSGDGGLQISPGPLQNHVERMGSSDSSLDRHFNSSSPLSPTLGSTFTPSETSPSFVAPRGNPSLSGTFAQELNRPNQRVSLQITNGTSESRQNGLSAHLLPDASKSKASPQTHPLKAPPKPMWMDVSVLPRIPKIKREGSSDDTACKTNDNANKTNESTGGSSSAHGNNMPDTVINRLAGDKERGHSVDQQHGRTAGPRSRPDGAGSSSGFSSSFSSSASGSHTNHQRFSSGSSSSSSSVSFRINSSGNSWHSRRLNIASLTPSGSSFQENCTEEEKKRQLHRDKQKLLASRSKDSNNIYDPFNPTESDSGSSDGESGSINVECSSRLKQEPVKLKNKVFSKSRWDLKQVKVETHSQDKPVTTAPQGTLTQQRQSTKINAPFRKSRFSHIERPSPFNTVIKKEPESDEEEKHAFDSETEDTSQPIHQSLELIKTKTMKEEPTPELPAASCDGNSSSTSSSSPVRKSLSPNRKLASSPVRISTSSPTRKTDSSPARKFSSSPGKKTASSPGRKSASRKSASSPSRKCTTSSSLYSPSSPPRNSASSPPRNSASSPPQNSASSPPRNSASSPPRNSASNPPRNSASSPSRKSTSSPRKSASSPSRKSTSSPSRKLTSSPSRKSVSSPSRKSALSPSRKSALSPSRKSASSPSRKSAPSPSRKSALSPSRKSASSPTRKSALSPSRKSASSPSRKSASSPTRKSALSPSRKSASSPSRKSASSPSRKSAPSPSRKSASSPSRKSASSPSRKSASSPSRKSASSPSRKSALSPSRKSASSPSRKSASSPSRKSASSPSRKSAPSPSRKFAPSPSRKSASSPVRKSESQTKSELHKNQSKESGSEKNSSKRNVSSKDERGRSSSTERPQKTSSPDRDRKHGHIESKHGGSQKDKDKAKSSRRSRSKERKQTHRDSDSSHSKSPDRLSKKRRRSRSRSKDRRKSRSCSSSSSRERSKTKKHKKRSRERNEDKDLQRRASKDKKRDRSRSKSRSKSRSRSRERRHARSRSRSRDRRYARSRSRSRSRSREKRRARSRSRSRERRHGCSRSKSRSRSRERRHARSRSRSRERRHARSRSRSKERRHARSRSKSRSRTRSPSRERRKIESRRQSSRDEAESRSKDKKRRRSRSNSREKKDRHAAKVQKALDNSNSTVKDKKTSKDKKIDDFSSVKAERASKTNKPSSSSSTFSSTEKKELKESKVDEKPVETDVNGEKTKREIKQEKCLALDIFEDSPTSSPVKKDELDIPAMDVEIKCEEDKQIIIKTEVCEDEKLEVTSPDKKPSAPDSPMFSVLPPTVFTPPQEAEEQSTEVPTISTKQEPLAQSSDSDDDFNVDVMLDNLDLVKSRLEEKTEATVKEEKSEGEAVAVGPKSKTQVKRVTWNIEEPVGPQPEKSASKVALYKMKLKQEGIRRPSAAFQDLTGTATAGDVTKPCIDPEPQALSASSQGQTDEGDILKKDKTYLKKLHMQERAIEEVKLAIKPFYQKRDINKDEYKEILRKAVQKVCHSKSGEINPVKVGNLVKAYVDKYKHARKYKKGDEPGKSQDLLKPSDSP